MGGATFRYLVPPRGSGGGGGGDVTGPAGAVADDIAIFNGATGKIIKDSGFTIAQVIAASVLAVGSGQVFFGQNILGADAPSVSFFAIPQTMRHLRVICNGRLTSAFAADLVTAQYNGDTAAKYSYQQMFTANATTSFAAFYGQTSQLAGFFPGAGSLTATEAGDFEWVIENYSAVGVFDKMGRSGCGFVNGNSGTSIGYMDVCNHWSDTAAITQITFLPASGNFQAGSTFSLYGMP